MREDREADLDSGLECFRRECRGSVLEHGDVVAQLDGIAPRRFNARVGDEPSDDDVRNAMLAQLIVEIGVCEAAGGEMLRRYDIACVEVWLELLMELTTPGALGEELDRLRPDLRRGGVLPVRVVTRAILAMRHEEDGNPSRAR